jgi:hypothetical protein
MAKTKDKKLYNRLRASGVRKKVARDLTALPAEVKGGKKAPKPLREAVDRLDRTVSELRGHVGAGERSSAAKKAARTRKANAKRRSASASKGARRRAKT